MDLDGDGTIDFQEFITAATDHQKILTEENIKYAFNTFDLDGDGSITINEFLRALPQMSESKDAVERKTIKEE